MNIDIVEKPYDLRANADTAWFYEQQEQWAAAMGFYLRAAEYGIDLEENTDIMECLIRAGECLFKLGSRLQSVKTTALHALSLCPDSPEPYWFLSRVYEAEQSWFECNAISRAGLLHLDRKSDFTYNNKEKELLRLELLFQRAISEYHIGRIDSAQIYLCELEREANLPKWMDAAIERSLKTIGYPTRYKSYFLDKEIASYSQSGQDVLVSRLHPQKGYYLEIGSSYPIKQNNTYLLEQCEWDGISIELDKGLVNHFNTTRENKAVHADATKIDYKELLKDSPKIIDYLQIDCDPPNISYEVLTKIPFDEYEFKIITFEHDAYVDPRYRTKSRTFLSNLGYTLFIGDVTHNEKESYEDWWVNPKYITEEIIKNSGINKDFSSPIDIY